jgi:hypothetical protein
MPDEQARRGADLPGPEPWRQRDTGHDRGEQGAGQLNPDLSGLDAVLQMIDEIKVSHRPDHSNGLAAW